MNCTVTIDGKFVVALGVATAAIIFVTKIDEAAAKEVSIHAIEAFKVWSTAKTVSC